MKKIGPNLKEVRKKLKPEWIHSWLRDPRAFRATTKMPQFRVNDDEAWPAVCERLLRERHPDKKLQVRNLAVPGYSTFQGRVMFERHALAGEFRPQLVVFAFGFNDGFVRSADDATTRTAERFLHETWAGGTKRWLQRHSRFFSWLWERPEASDAEFLAMEEFTLELPDFRARFGPPRAP